MMREYEDGIVLFKAEMTEVWNKVAVTDSALHVYYNANKDKFKTSPKVSYGEIHVATDTLALTIYDSLTRGSDFFTMAERYNEDPTLRTKHNRRDSVNIGTDVASKLADSLAIGEISEPYSLDIGGYSIIKVVEKLPARDKTFEEAGAEISNLLQEDESKRLEKEWLERLKVKYPVKQYKERLPQAFGPGSKLVQ